MITKSARRLGAILALALVASACRNTPVAAPSGSDELTAAVRAAALPITGAATDYDPLLTLSATARVVLLGEATHGTHEFYRERARISRELITRHGYAAIMVEGAWMDAARVNRYIRGEGTDRTAEAALSGFDDFPRWMWRNAEMVELIEWLRAYNRTRPPGGMVSFYGLDVYGFYQAKDEVIAYLDRADPAAASEARERYDCFGRFQDEEAYGRRAGLGTARGCETEAAEQLETMQRRLTGGALADVHLFAAVQNARVVKNGERYYRSAFGGAGGSSWNIRDRHMAETAEAVVSHLEARGQSGKVVGWAHNSHVGDARATRMGEEGEINIGQLMRERYGEEAVLVGFTTYTGTVIAAREWGESGRRRNVRPARRDSYEALFHAVDLPAFLLVVRGEGVSEGLREERLERAIGVLYLPETELASHYFRARLSEQFDVLVHFDVTRALAPL